MKKAILLLSASLLLLFGACGVVPDYSTDIGDNQGSGITVQTQSPDKSIEEIVAGEKVIYAEEDETMDDSQQQLGTVLLSQELQNSVSIQENKDAYFYAKLDAYFGFETEFEYEGIKYKQWWNVPALQAYDAAYDIWLQDVYPGLREQMQSAAENGEEQVQGWENQDPHEYFDIYYEHTQTEEVLSEWKAARDIALAAEQAYIDWTNTDEYLEQEYSLLKSETQRLLEKGYLVELNGWDMVGYLSSEQINNFDCGEYGYSICLAVKADS